jgi:hypothetical protein
MTSEKTNQKNEHEEKSATMGCCSPQKFAEMMGECGEDVQCECGPMMKGMQEMMKGGCRQPEQK